MTHLQISKALALAIGYLPEHIRVREPSTAELVLKRPFETRVEVWREAAHSGLEMIKKLGEWRTFDHRDWSVIGPIGELYGCFPIKHGLGWLSLVHHHQPCEYANNPQTAIALAVIGSKQ